MAEFFFFLRLVLPCFVLAAFETLAAHRESLAESGEVGCEVASAGGPAVSPGRSLLHEFNARGIALSSAAGDAPGWEWSLALVAVGRGTEVLCAGEPELHVQPGRVEYRRPGIVEWYVDHRRGIEHGFTLESPPPVEGTGALRLLLEVGGALQPAILPSERGARFATADGRSVLLYDGLVVLDAEHRPLPARLALEGEWLVIEFEDAGACWPIVVDPVIYTEDWKIESDPTRNKVFGFAAAGAGDTLVVGDYDIQGNPGYGGAFVYVRSDSGWVEQARLFASDGAADRFGFSVAISDDTIAVGAHQHDTRRGAVYVFTRSGSAWSEAQKLTASDALLGDDLGYSVSIQGGTILAGAPGRDDLGSSSGCAYVYCHNGLEWVETAKLLAPDGGVIDRFGGTVLLQGPYAFCAAFGKEEAGVRCGAVYVFEGGCGSWSFRTKIVPYDCILSEWGTFGFSLVARDGLLVVGSPNGYGTAWSTGAVYVYQHQGASWNLEAKLFASDGDYQHLFGWATALQGDFLIIGATDAHGLVAGSGACYTYRSSPTHGWVEDARLIASDGKEYSAFGVSVASLDGVVAVGDHKEGSLYTGAVYLFELEEKVQPYCFGDGRGAPCPCGNSSAAGAESGCTNSTGQGGRLAAAGTTSLSAGDLVLHAEQLVPNQPALLFAGEQRLNGGAGIPFGDGLRCAGGAAVRFPIHSADPAGNASWGPGLALSAGWQFGDRSHFQVWYRDPIGSPCGAGFNTTNALTIRWIQ